jgi:hypothetical protein
MISLKGFVELGANVAKVVKEVATTVKNSESIAKAISKLSGSKDIDDQFELAIYRLYDEILKIEKDGVADSKMNMDDFKMVENYPKKKFPIVICERDLTEDVSDLSKKIEGILQKGCLDSLPSVRRRFRVFAEILGIDYRELYKEAKAQRGKMR